LWRRVVVWMGWRRSRLLSIAPARLGCLPDWLRSLERNHAIKVLCGASSPAESLVRDCWDFGVTVEVVDTTDHAIACSKFATLVDERAIRHLGGEDLRSSIKGAGRRPLNDAWLWSRKNSTVNIAPLVAATLASWAFVSSVSEGAFV
jgi:hypothetical protein